MAQDKQLSRIEAKLDALLEKGGLKPTDYAAPVTTSARPPRPLTAVEQQAIDNAPKTPTGANGPADQPRVDQATNAPSTPTPPATPPAMPPSTPPAASNGEPFAGYNSLSADQVVDRLGTLDDDGRARVLAHERARGSRGRKTIIDTLVSWNS